MSVRIGYWMSDCSLSRLCNTSYIVFLGECVRYCKWPVLVTEALLIPALRCWSMTISSHRPCNISAALALSIWVAHQKQEDSISQSNRLIDRGCSSKKKPLKILQRLTILLQFWLFFFFSPSIYWWPDMNGLLTLWAMLLRHFAPFSLLGRKKRPISDHCTLSEDPLYFGFWRLSPNQAFWVHFPLQCDSWAFGDVCLWLNLCSHSPDKWMNKAKPTSDRIKVVLLTFSFEAS